MIEASTFHGTVVRAGDTSINPVLKHSEEEIVELKGTESCRNVAECISITGGQSVVSSMAEAPISTHREDQDAVHSLTPDQEKRLGRSVMLEGVV